MKSKIFVGFMVVLITIFLSHTTVFSALTGLLAHEKYIYPVVRITDSSSRGGSGTVIYSKDKSTYVLTNHHVIAASIKIEDEWDRDLQKNVKKEKLSVMYVEIFKYKNISIPIGALKVEADIVAYNRVEDMALLKLRSEEPYKYVADLYPRNKLNDIHVMDETVAVGCSLLLPPLPTVGVITRQNHTVDSYMYNMSSSQLIYGNSGGAMFLVNGDFIGIPSMVNVTGWGVPITHMGYFIPIRRIYNWLEKEHFEFIWDTTKTESDCMVERKKEIEKKKRLDK